MLLNIELLNLLNTIPLTRIKALVNNLLMSKFLKKNNLQHKLRIFEMVIKRKIKAVNPAKPCVRKILRMRKNFTYTKLRP